MVREQQGQLASVTSEGRRADEQRLVARRSLARGAAWAVPAVMMASAAPAMAASATSCKTATMSWGTAKAPKIANPTTITITGATQTIYAKVTYVDDAVVVDNSGVFTPNNTTAKYHLGIGKSADGSAVGVYAMTTTNGANDLVLNQRTGGTSATTVTVAFYSDAALTRPVYVNNLVVPLDDFSSGTSWSGLTCTGLGDFGGSVRYRG